MPGTNRLASNGATAAVYHAKYDQLERVLRSHFLPGSFSTLPRSHHNNKKHMEKQADGMYDTGTRTPAQPLQNSDVSVSYKLALIVALRHETIESAIYTWYR